MQGSVAKKFTSKKGTACLEIGGQVYICPKVDIRNVQVGDELDFSGHSFGDGKMWEMDAFKLLRAYAPTPPSPTGSGQIAAPGPLQPPPAGLSEGERAFISNMCAHAIDKGLITDQATLGMWAVWAKNAIREAAMPTFETDIP